MPAANPATLSQIDTIVFLMMENRSFDQMLGYLCLPPHSRIDIEGFKEPIARYRQDYRGTSFDLYNVASASDPLKTNDPKQSDPGHERADICTQIADGAMSGFVQSYPYFDPRNGNAVVMGYFDAEQLPAFHFFTQHFAICDHWFSSVPAATQPNRLMSLSGFTRTDTSALGLPNQEVVFDWLQQRHVRTRVYRGGFPFITLMDGWGVVKVSTDERFRPLSDFASDWANESASTFPEVVFIDPHFTDDPLSPGIKNDDHAPTAISHGQDLLVQLYVGMTANPQRWSRTLFVITYDENGGFYDHVPPPKIETQAPPGATYETFATLGIRVPGIVISPFVESGAVYSGTLDHVSFLKLLGEKFSLDGKYSPIVDARPVDSLSAILTRNTPRADIPQLIQPTPRTVIASSFQKSVDEALLQAPTTVLKRFPHLRSLKTDQESTV